jgi:hypothetical protein
VNVCVCVCACVCTAASSRLLSPVEMAVTVQPMALANWIAMCPSPPTPMTPTHIPGLHSLQKRVFSEFSLCLSRACLGKMMHF